MFSANDIFYFSCQFYYLKIIHCQISKKILYDVRRAYPKRTNISLI